VCYVCLYSYMAQILNETLRWAVIGPYAARAQNKDTVIAGHHIPAGVCFCLYAAADVQTGNVVAEENGLGRLLAGATHSISQS